MGTLDLPHVSLFKGGSETFLRNVFENILKTYLRKNPTAKTIWELVQSVDNEKICYDHFTFRTLKVDGYGIDSLSSFFMDYGYKIGGGLDFPKKKLRVLWFSPPDAQVPNDGHGLANGPLPRLVIAEVLVDELSLESQGIIRKYLKPLGGKQAVLSSTLGSLIWEKPTWADFTQLAKESEFAAWTLIHGYTMNHLAFAVHRFKHRFKCFFQFGNKSMKRDIHTCIERIFGGFPENLQKRDNYTCLCKVSIKAPSNHRDQGCLMGPEDSRWEEESQSRFRQTDPELSELCDHESCV
ncbi:unnamed protein product [Brassica napus]|uniref:2-oxoadipate dioxygenase/decarboxylase n=1 Tax=Brassica napus TaxID=3708 RepID=A0A816MA18_BRANA|nr:unnamed protein product [Brassica napus]